MKKGTKAALAFAVSISLLLNAALASSAVTLESPNPQNIGWFGLSVAISGTTVVVGAPEEDVLVFPIAVFLHAGQAYVIDATSGSLVSTLTSHNAVANGEFGASVAISGMTVVVGAPHETAGGNAYVFDAASGSLIRTLPSPNGGGFGASVAISGTTVVVGAPSETAGGQAFAGRAYTLDATTGTVIATLDSPYAQYKGDFGVSVAINECDPTVVVGAPGETASGQFVAGHAYLFRI